MGEDHLALLMQVASWYYEERLCQADIARRIGRSRSMVSRLLQEARDKGVVKIQVLSPFLNRVSELEDYLCQSFGLSQAYVLADPPVDYPLLIRRLGELGAHALGEDDHDAGDRRVPTQTGSLRQRLSGVVLDHRPSNGSKDRGKDRHPR